MKILIINVDYDYRSIYTGMIAACLATKIPGAQITGFISTDNDLLSTTGIFKELHFFDTAKFFEDTKDVDGDGVSDKIRSALTPVMSTRWDVVINLSSNLLGAMFPSFLSYGEVKGSFVDESMNGIKHSDLSSYFLSGMPDDLNTYLPFTYLYRSILKRFEEVTLNSVWEKHLASELDEYFRALRSKHGRQKIVFIDFGLRHTVKDSDIEFYSELYRKLHEHKDVLPIFLTKRSLTSDDALIMNLREHAVVDVHSFVCATQAQLSVINQGEMVITTDLYCKSMADVGLRPSVLVSPKLNLADYSVVDGSFQVVTSQRSRDAVEHIVALCHRSLVGSALTPGRAREGIEVYRTVVHANLPVPVPLLTNGNIKYASWWLRLKFLGSFLDLELPKVAIEPMTYRTAILQERNLKEQQKMDGISFFALELAKADIKMAPRMDQHIVESRLAQFFDGEEAAL